MKIVVALGGNALGNTSAEQKEIVKVTAAALADVIEAGNTLVVAHGNGPQVGMINLAFDIAEGATDKVSAMEFPECGAMSQGYIGYHLQNALANELAKRNINKPVVTLVTQVLVNTDDPAFENPTKPIGGYYSAEEAKALEENKGFVMREIPGKGMRRVVPSPIPEGIVEIEAVKSLVESGAVVITVGGGGIPVVKTHNGLEGVAAVIDKDYASAKLAELISADDLVILTAVDKVAINFGKEDEQSLDSITVKEAEKYAEEGQFGKGSMLPKVNAAVSFVKRTGRRAIIASLENAKEAIEGRSGTFITLE